MNYFDKLNPAWMDALKSRLTADYFSEMNVFLDEKYSSKTVFPPKNNIFAAFDHFSPTQTKIVIIGQDPYHGKGQANGLAFSVTDGVAHPASLRNIFKAVNIDLGVEFQKNRGDLTSWAKQGVLLINSVLTVEEGSAASHRKRGWEVFTDEVITMLSESVDGVVYILWGKDAWEKEKLIDKEKNLILKSVHPSPLSAYRGFFEAHHFSQTNNYLKSIGRGEIDFGLLQLQGELF